MHHVPRCALALFALGLLSFASLAAASGDRDPLTLYFHADGTMTSDPRYPDGAPSLSTRDYASPPAALAFVLHARPTITVASGLLLHGTLVARLDIGDHAIGFATIRSGLLGPDALAQATFDSRDTVVPQGSVLSVHVVSGGREGLLRGIIGTRGIWRFDAQETPVPVAPPAASPTPPAQRLPPTPSPAPSPTPAAPTPAGATETPASSATGAPSPATGARSAFAFSPIAPRVPPATGAAVTALVAATGSGAALVLLRRP